MFTLVRFIVETFGPTLTWLVVYVVSLIAVFVLLIGTCVLATIFHPDARAARRAMKILAWLLAYFFRGRK